MFIKNILENQKNNEKIAVEFGHNSISYKSLYDKVILNFSLLRNKMNGVNNVGLFIPNSIDYIIGYFTITFLDKVIIPIEPTSKEKQIDSIVRYCELKTIVTNTEYKNKLINLLNKDEIKIKIFNLDNQSIEEFGSGCLVTITEGIDKKITEDSVAIMLHTSGTTSTPKRVMLTHKNLISNINSNILSLKFTSEDRCLIVLPMFFGYCNTSQLLTHFYLGASVVINDSIFIPERFLNLIAEKGCTNTTCVPSMLLLILNNNKVNKGKIKSLRYLCFGGGSMTVEKLKELIEYFPYTGIVQTYGQTEASPRVTCLLPEDSLRKVGSVGKTIPDVELKIVNENDQEVPDGEIGEIVIKGENVMKGYFKREEETQKVKRHGWLHSGDLGRIDEEGYLYIVGRIKNIIINGGLNIYPEEIEELLINYKGIKEAVVVAQKHDLLGEVPIAKVVLNDDIDNITEFDIIKYCSKNLETHKVPSKVIFCDKLEKTYTGKIKRN